MRDRKTGESRGFCFLAYVDQRSTDLAVDNLNGAAVRNPILNENLPPNRSAEEQLV